MDSDQFLSLSQASALLPGTPHLSTLHRWRLRGIRGAKLRTTLVGGRRYTTKSWLQEFLDACSSSSLESPAQPSLIDSRTKQIEAAESEVFGDVPDTG